MTNAKMVKELRKTVALSCRIIGNRGVTKGSFGNVSARIPGAHKFLIKSKGPNEAAVELATEKDIITIDLEGKFLEGSKGLDAPQ